MNSRTDSLGQNSAKQYPLRFLIFLCLAAPLLVAAGCKKKSAPASGAGVRSITRELVLAARNASGGRAQVSTRPAYAPRQSSAAPPAAAGAADKAQTPVADHIYITIPLAKSGQPDWAAHDAIETELARVAEAHHLKRISQSGSPGLERFDYAAEGQRTESIHLITPLPKRADTSRVSDQPRLAIVIDDLGHDRRQADSLFRLAYPLTISVLPHLPNSGEIAEEAHWRGYQVMLHLPMASNAGDKDEPIELRPGMEPSDVEQTFASMLDTVPFAAGVNNHEGSLGTSDPELMGELMPLLRQRNLFFIDSRTTASTVAEAAAHDARVPAASRNVFLDDEETPSAIRKQFELAIRDAKQKGSALAIGHPHPETLQVLNEMLPLAERQGVQLVFASSLAR